MNLDLQLDNYIGTEEKNDKANKKWELENKEGPSRAMDIENESLVIKELTILDTRQPEL